MVTGNFALLAGIDPAAIEEWYLVVYADAFEWVGAAQRARDGDVGRRRS
jgi:deoxyribodipyrimidine photolyase-related protein